MTDVGIEDLVQMLKRGAENIRLSLDREDDWVPVFAFTDRNGEPHLIDATTMMLGPSFQREGIKAVAEILAEQGASNVAMIQTIWTIANVDEAGLQQILDGSSPRPRNSPARIEMLMILALDRDGSTRGANARIYRRSDYTHPKLGPWEDVPDGADYFGGMIDPIKAVIVRG